jgi:hypothetical protein
MAFLLGVVVINLGAFEATNNPISGGIESGSGKSCISAILGNR